MSSLRFQLFGKFKAQRGTRPLKGLEASKDQELLSYLLVYRDQYHPRETLATLLWGDTAPERSKKYLRQSLWHLQSALSNREFGEKQLLKVGHDWLKVDTSNDFWLDVAIFEYAFAKTQGASGRELTEPDAEMLKDAVQFYTGDFLEGCYHDWCLYERDRLQSLYLLMLDKLMAYSEQHNDYEAALTHGRTILKYDPARETTHRQMMCMQYKAGDRTGALRQYERCVRALKEELGVTPQRDTTELYEQLRSDRLNQAQGDGNGFESRPVASLPEVIGRLKRRSEALGELQRTLERDIDDLERLTNNHHA